MRLEHEAQRADSSLWLDAARTKALEAENRGHRRAKDILLAASSFFARELDPRLPW